MVPVFGSSWTTLQGLATVGVSLRHLDVSKGSLVHGVRPSESVSSREVPSKWRNNGATGIGVHSRQETLGVMAPQDMSNLTGPHDR